jgi:hypothetical protein
VAFVLYLIASVLALIHSTGSNRNRNDNLYLTAAVSVTSDPARLLARFAADTHLVAHTWPCTQFPFKFHTNWTDEFFLNKFLLPRRLFSTAAGALGAVHPALLGGGFAGAGHCGHAQCRLQSVRGWIYHAYNHSREGLNNFNYDRIAPANFF